MSKEALIAINTHGSVLAACSYEPGSQHFTEAVIEWVSDPGVRELIRVPVAVARDFLFKDWPGLEEALKATE